MKGTEVHRGRGFASKSFKPSAEADGKREDEGALGIADTDTYTYYNRRYRQSQEKAQLSWKGLSGRAFFPSPSPLSAQFRHIPQGRRGSAVALK